MKPTGSCWTVILGEDPWRRGWEQRCAKGAVMARCGRPTRRRVAQQRVLAPDMERGGVLEEIGVDVKRETDGAVET